MTAPFPPSDMPAAAPDPAIDALFAQTGTSADIYVVLPRPLRLAEPAECVHCHNRMTVLAAVCISGSPLCDACSQPPYPRR